MPSHSLLRHQGQTRVTAVAALAVGVVTYVQLMVPVAAAATLTVTTTRDELVAHDGRCSLREAIEAVESPGTRTGCGRISRCSNTIVLGLGRYMLSIPRAGADNNTSGDLNVHGAAPRRSRSPAPAVDDEHPAKRVTPTANAATAVTRVCPW